MRRFGSASSALAAVALRRRERAGQARGRRRRRHGHACRAGRPGADEDDLLQQVITEFEKTHPSIKVDYSVINGDYPTAMTARFAAHNPPDVFYVDSSLASDLGAAGRARSRSTATSSRRSTTPRPFYPEPAERLQGRRQDVRLPEGLVAARDGDQHRPCSRQAGA